MLTKLGILWKWLQDRAFEVWIMFYTPKSESTPGNQAKDDKSES